MRFGASDQRCSLVAFALTSRLTRGDSTQICAGEAGMPATIIVGALDAREQIWLRETSG